MSNFEILQEPTVIRAIVANEITANAVPTLKAELREALDKSACDIVFDFQQVQKIDATGIGLLLAAKNSVAAQKSSLQLINVPANIFSLLKSMRLVSHLNAVRQD
jgi:anti-anti-sigma factor